MCNRVAYIRLDQEAQTGEEGKGGGGEGGRRWGRPGTEEGGRIIGLWGLLGLKGVWSRVPEQVSWPERDAYNRGGGRGLNLWAEARGRV